MAETEIRARLDVNRAIKLFTTLLLHLGRTTARTLRLPEARK
jgi:hypothetical protein